MSVCGDKDRVWFPQRTICYAEMETAAARRIFDDLHGEKTGRRFHNGDETVWSENESPSTPIAAGDGQSIWVSVEDLNPDDDFLSGGA